MTTRLRWLTRLPMVYYTLTHPTRSLAYCVLPRVDLASETLSTRSFLYSRIRLFYSGYELQPSATSALVEPSSYPPRAPYSVTPCSLSSAMQRDSAQAGITELVEGLP